MAGDFSGRDSLPPGWYYDVTSDGRVFFMHLRVPVRAREDDTHVRKRACRATKGTHPSVTSARGDGAILTPSRVCAHSSECHVDRGSEDTRSTTWLHPRTSEPVSTGHRHRSDLPRGWEEGFTPEGASFFIDHNERVTTFFHPETGHAAEENAGFLLNDTMPYEERGGERPGSLVSNTTNTTLTTTTHTTSTISKKAQPFGKGSAVITRNPKAPVVKYGWLFKQDSAGMKLWKRRWFVLSDLCLFYYKDSKEEQLQGSILLPSYEISPVELPDNVTRKYAFKMSPTGQRAYYYSRDFVMHYQAQQTGRRTYFLAAESQRDAEDWMAALGHTALSQPRRNGQGGGGPNQHAERLHHEEPARNGRGDHHGLGGASGGGAGRGEGPRSPRRAPRSNGGGGAPAAGPGAGGGGGGRRELRLSDSDSGGGDARATVAQPRHGEGPRAHVWPEVAGTVARGPYPSEGAHPPRGPDPRQPHQPVIVSRPPRSNHGQGPNPARQSGPQTQTMPRLRREVRPDMTDQARPSQPALPSRLAAGPGAATPASTAPAYSTRTLPVRGAVGGAPEAAGGGGRGQRHAAQHGANVAARPGDYKYAQDRVILRGMNDEDKRSSKEGTVWRLYEWQQRQLFRQGIAPPSRSPTEAPASPSVDRGAGPFAGAAARSSRGVTSPHAPVGRVAVAAGRYSQDDAGTARRAPAGAAYKSPESQDRRSLPGAYSSLPHSVTTYSLSSKPMSAAPSSPTGGHLPDDKEIELRLGRLCEEDQSLRSLTAHLQQLQDDKARLEEALETTHRQMQEFRGQPAHQQKILYQQRLLQEDLVQLLAQISHSNSEWERVMQERRGLEREARGLQDAAAAQLARLGPAAGAPAAARLQKQLWRMEDVLRGLQYVGSAGQRDGSTRDEAPQPRGGAPVDRGYEPPPPPRNYERYLEEEEERAPPRPPLPRAYSPDDAAAMGGEQPPSPSAEGGRPPDVPPLPRETQALRHTSVRELKRQSGERRRDREHGGLTNGDYQYHSEPELSIGANSDPSSSLYRSTLPGQSQMLSVSSFVTLRRSQTEANVSSQRDRPRSALERLYSGGGGGGGRMSAEEQLARMKRNQRTLQRQRKRSLSSASDKRGGGASAATAAGGGGALANSRAAAGGTATLPARPHSASFAYQHWDPEESELRPSGGSAVSWGWDGGAPPRSSSSSAPPAPAAPPAAPPRAERSSAPRGRDGITEIDVEPDSYEVDLFKELGRPDKVVIPERYMEMEPEEALGPEEMEARRRTVAKIQNLLARSSGHAVPVAVAPGGEAEVPGVSEDQERIISMSHALASEASRRSKAVAARKRCASLSEEANDVFV
ncbi:pleckstrin homology domain-containing family A member 7 isoform X3 [Lethenteron reissneri]|uniref:pleckstrin homology domain-containing family A member 7 isoform X3 n=1 Tax=Lethenteron reissneri TaxID=7753 RepID=UPI002AB6E60A|nr:pleckstrin homology domain-containing family A member 7 isoform X3 [Lethenteron reissneri]